MGISTTVAFLSLLLCVFSSSILLLDPKTEEFKEYYMLGQAEADSEIAMGEATIYVYGFMSSYINLNKETGLPNRAIAGCVIDMSIRARSEGHNDRIRQYIEENGVPSYSRKKWERELYDLKAYFKERTKKENPNLLEINGSKITSSNNKYSLHLEDTSNKDKTDFPFDFTIFLKKNGKEFKTTYPYGSYIARKTEFFWGPNGSDVAFFRWSELSDNRLMNQVYGVLDLRNAGWLRVETDTKKVKS
jgi:hypothetical protein